MKRLSKTIAIIALAFMVSGCLVEHYQTIWVVYANESNHNITIDNWDGIYTVDSTIFPMVIESGQTVLVARYGIDTTEPRKKPNYNLCEIPYKVDIYFDNKYKLRAFHNKIYEEEESQAIGVMICNEQNYSIKREDNTTWSFTYTFTDEDYEYAKKFGENLYEIE